jgi:hypothetical protein
MLALGPAISLRYAKPAAARRPVINNKADIRHGTARSLSRCRLFGITDLGNP